MLDTRYMADILVDVAFLISDHFKKQRTGAKTSYGDVLYSELGGRKLA